MGDATFDRVRVRTVPISEWLMMAIMYCIHNDIPYNKSLTDFYWPAYT